MITWQLEVYADFAAAQDKDRHLNFIIVQEKIIL